MSEPTDEEILAQLTEARSRVRVVTDEGPVDDVAPGLTALHPYEAALSVLESDPSAITFPSTRVLDEWEPECVSCGALLGYLVKRHTYGAVTECPRCRAGSVEQRLRMSGISHREINQPLEALISSGEEFDCWMAFCRRFAALQPKERIDPPFAFVCGNNGVGKSSGAQRALRDAIRNGCAGRFVRFSELISKIYATYGRGEVDERTADVVRFYATVHLLVIDEVGLEIPTENAMGLFFDFVDDRYNAQLPTIFTSNYALTEGGLGAHITERTSDHTRMLGILDRLRGGTGENVFVITGESRR